VASLKPLVQAMGGIVFVYLCGKMSQELCNEGNDPVIIFRGMGDLATDLDPRH
jgi:hypothetical protein